ncbi:AmmeMemoRadiSam system protein A [Desulfosarcina sp. OttesenSCG-928-G10]|nr:AmmeMemoRadiSam system protein A [Desulfosarcina sp. OttesenSCG-928-G10]MDL2321295.1 AmmeMemoRadiSam system protein A [Desulfosarcina sp. OttesenSCG-928-B08]
MPASAPRLPLTPDQGSALVTLARNTLRDHFGEPVLPVDDRYLTELSAVHRGTFVTLTLDGQLRGCIGNLVATGSVVAGVQDNALHAAFHDSRFAPLTRAELDRIHIEVSVLTDPTPFPYTSGADLAARLRPGIDGVILRKGRSSATFLPQVWEDLSTPDIFLSHLCLKAGLSPKQWKKGDLLVSTYQVQYFEEDAG